MSPGEMITSVFTLASISVLGSCPELVLRKIMGRTGAGAGVENLSDLPPCPSYPRFRAVPEGVV